MNCLFLGDSIALGLGLLFSQCSVNAKVGRTSTEIVRVVKPTTKQTIISAGSNDPTNPNLKKNLIKIRSKIRSNDVTWILPVNKTAHRAVKLVANSYQDKMLSFTPSRDKVHPKSYYTLARKVKIKYNV